MAQGFYSGARGYTASLNEPEKDLLRGLFADVIELLTPEQHDDPLANMVGMASSERPEDPALARLLPDGVSGAGSETSGTSSEDVSEDAGEFRKLSENNIRTTKIKQLRKASLALNTRSALTLEAEEAMDFASALNSVRTVLAERLNIQSDLDAQKIHEHTDFETVENSHDYMAVVYNFLSWLQDTLMQAMLDAD